MKLANPVWRLALLTTIYAMATSAGAKHPLTFEDLMKVARISDPQVSPDGRWIVYEANGRDPAHHVQDRPESHPSARRA